MHAALALGDQAALDPFAQLAPRLGQQVGGLDLVLGLVGVRAQQIGQRLHGGVKGHAAGLVLKQGFEPAQHQRRPARGQQQPGRVLLARGDVFLRALLGEGGHGWEIVGALCPSGRHVNGSEINEE
ncbi:hypothetical protein MASR1M59_18730 [Melaminivora sp.]